MPSSKPTTTPHDLHKLALQVALAAAPEGVYWSRQVAERVSSDILHAVRIEVERMPRIGSGYIDPDPLLERLKGGGGGV